MDIQNTIINVYSHKKNEIFHRNEKLFKSLEIKEGYFNYSIYYEGDPDLPLRTKIFCGNIRINYEFIKNNHRLTYEWRGDFAKEALFLILSDMDVINYFSYKHLEKFGRGMTYMVYNKITNKKNLEFNRMPLSLAKEILNMTEIGHVGIILPTSPYTSDCIQFFETINRLKDPREYLGKNEAEALWQEEIKLAKNKNKLCVLCDHLPEYLPYLYFKDELVGLTLPEGPSYEQFHSIFSKK